MFWRKLSYQTSDVGRSAAVAAVYFATGQIGLLLGADYHFGAPIWLPAGVGIGAVLLLGYRIWPGLLLGSILTGATWLWKFSPTPLLVAGACLSLGLGNTLEALAAGWLIRRFANGTEAFRQPQTILIYVALAATCCLAIGASAATGACQILGILPGHNLGSFWFSLWLGRLVSAIVLTPVIVTWSRRRLPTFDLKRAAEAALLMVLALVLCELVFGDWFRTRPPPAPLAFLVIPALLWTALSFGQRGTASVAFIIATVATVATLKGYGPFALPDRDLSLLLLENFLAVITVMSLILAADVGQRQSIEERLRTSEQRYRDLFERNPQPVWVCDYETLSFLAVNEAAVQRYGYSRQEFLQMALTDLMPPETKPGLLETLARARRGEELHQEWRHRTKDGGLIHVEITARNLIFDQRPAAVMLSNDITERKRAELQMTAFSELGRRLSAARSPREAAQIVMGTADVLFGWEACFFELYSPEQKELTAVLCIDTIDGERKDVTSECVHPGPGTHAQDALEHGARLILRQSPPVFAPDMHPFGDKSKPSASLMFAPVRKEREAIAVLSIQSYTPNRYNESDLPVFQSLADHCASALERIDAEAEIQRLNRELRRHVEELQTMFNVAPVGIAVARDSDSQSITANPACAAMLGLPPDTTAASVDGLRILSQGRELNGLEVPMRQAASEGVSVNGRELEIVRPDGRVITCYTAASPLYDEMGRVRGSLGVFVDLTSAKRAEAALLESDERLRLALTASKMGTWTIELNEEPRVFLSPELEKIHGLEADEFAGTLAALFQLVHSEDRSAFEQAIDRAIETDGEYEVEFRFVAGNRAAGWLLARGRSLSGPVGQPRRVVGVSIDITARKQAEQEILRLNSELENRVRQRTAQLEAINKELEAFSYSVSHDLRAPLRSIRGFSEVLLERYAAKLDSRGQEFLRRACESSQQMDRLVEDLLKLSRVGRSELQQQSVNLSALAESVAEELRQSDRKRRVQFTIAPDLATRGDERLLRIVLENLLRNAWKFTSKLPESSIEFGFAPSPGAFFVRDNGAGFDMAYSSKLFGVFQRLHSVSDFPGTGVGLATVQRIINRHGGRVWAEAAIDKGANFYFSLGQEDHL